MGGCPVTSTPLQEILFSGNGCAVVIFWGGVSRAEKEYFTQGVEPSKPLEATTSRCTLRPRESWSQKETLCHHCPFTWGKPMHSVFGHAAPWGRAAPAEGTAATHAGLPCPEQQAGGGWAWLPALSSVLLALLSLHKQHLPGSYFLVSFARSLIFRTLFCSSYTDLFCERGYDIFWLKPLIFNNPAHLLSKSIVRLGNSFN